MRVEAKGDIHGRSPLGDVVLEWDTHWVQLSWASTQNRCSWSVPLRQRNMQLISLACSHITASCGLECPHTPEFQIWKRADTRPW